MSILKHLRGVYDQVITSLDGEKVMNKAIQIIGQQLVVRDNGKILKFDLKDRNLVILGAGQRRFYQSDFQLKSLVFPR